MAQMKIILNTSDGSAVSVDVRPDETYQMLKERVQEESGLDLEISQIFYNGNPVASDQNVYDTFLELNSVNKSVEKTGRICVVEACTTTSLTDPKKEIFHFPLEADKYSDWLLACNRHDLLGRIPRSLNLECGVCSNHFPDSCFVSGSMRRRLRKNALPVLEEQQDSLTILGHGLMEAEEKQEDGLSSNECTSENVAYVIDNSDSAVPLISNPPDQEERQSPKKDESASENTSNQGEVDEEDLQEDELEELEEDEGEEDDVEEDDEDILINTTCQSHPGLICRLCAQAVDTAHFIFTEEGREEKLLDKINTSLPIVIRCNDLLPKQICGPCLTSLNICYDFAMTCVKAEGTLQKMIPRFLCQRAVVSPIKQSSNQDSTPKHDQQVLDEGKDVIDDLKCYDCPLCCQGSMRCKDDINLEELEGKEVNDDPDIVQEFLVDSVLWEEGEDLLEPDQNHPEDENGIYDSDDECMSCWICGANFVTLAHLFQHTESHCGDGYFPCGRCGLVFDSKETLSIHLDLHINSNTEEQYKCGYCGKLFASEVRAEFHHDVVHRQAGNSSLACSDCDQIFSQERNLWDHMQIVHRGQRPFSCPICEKTFQIRSHLKSHMRAHASNGPFGCDMCSKTFVDKDSLKAHEVTHADMKLFQCDQCGRCFTRKYLFTAHVRSHTVKKPRVYTCRICGEDGFTSLPKLLVHRRSKHQDVMLPLGSKKEKIHKCEQCNKAFTGRVALKHHVMSHAGNLPFVCEFCNKGFTQKRSLLLHRRIHTGEKPYQCGDCGKRFVQSAHLYSHLRLHTGEKPYECSECGATFRLKDVRDSHQRKHTGERPFKCKVCEKSFRTSHSYYQHSWIHTGRKPYPCTYCGKAFRRSNGLKVHIRIHTGEKPHECDVCGRGFAQKQDMKKHRNLHTMGRL